MTTAASMSQQDVEDYVSALPGWGQDGKVLLPAGRHLILRAGHRTRLYSRRMCSCGKSKCVPYLYSRSATAALCRGRYDVALVETCMECGQHRIWDYMGPAPEGWKDERVPALRDSQRQRLYDWQNREPLYLSNYATERLTEDETFWLVRTLFQKYGMREPTVVVGRQSWMRGNERMCLAAGWGHTRRVVVHETAHAVTCTICIQNPGKKDAGHGPLYCAVFAILLTNELRNDPCASTEIVARTLIDRMRQFGLKADDYTETLGLILSLRRNQVTLPMAANEES